MCLYSSVMKLWQNAIISLSDLPLGSKSEPPLPPPIGSPVREFLKICSNPRNLIMPMFTDGWSLIPPLYGPIALLNCTRNPLLTWTCPLSSTQGTRNRICLSGSTSLSRRASLRYFSSLASTIGFSDSNTSFTAWWNSGCAGFFSTTFAITSSTYDILLSS